MRQILIIGISKDKKDRITEVEPNQLYKFVNGALVSKTPYDRTECLQKKPYTSTTQYYGRDYGYNLIIISV